MNETDTKTLCALQEEGLIDADPEAFVKLIQPASFFCKNCGRSAVKNDNLCNPEALN